MQLSSLAQTAAAVELARQQAQGQADVQRVRLLAQAPVLAPVYVPELAPVPAPAHAFRS
jgi:hypothetical protein